MKRGDVVLCAIPGDFGKVRPSVIVQATVTLDSHPSITVCPITSDCCNAKLTRILLKPTSANGLQKESQIMVDKIGTVKRDRIVKTIGALSQTNLNKLNFALQSWLSLMR